MIFDANGGTGEMSAQSFTAGLSHALKANEFIAPTGMKFAGWSLIADAESAELADGTDGAGLASTDGETVTLYAIWIDKDALAITYELNSGENASGNPSSFKESVSVTLSEPTRSCYGFLGWYESEDFSGSAITEIASSMENKTLCAKWILGTKEAPDTVGDIVFSNGRATPYTSTLTLDDEAKVAAISVIFYVGTELNSDDDTTTNRTLGVGLQNATGDGNKLKWEKAKTNYTYIVAIQCTPSESGEGKAASATFTGDLDGSDNWTAICAAVTDEDTSGNYPLWEWMNSYATNNSLTGECASGWYIPTIAELSMLYRAVKASDSVLNAAIDGMGGTQIADAFYWSSTPVPTSNSKAWSIGFTNGNMTIGNKSEALSVLAIREF